MTFYENFLKNQKKNTQVDNRLTGTFKKTQSILPKSTPQFQTQNTAKHTITPTNPRISDAILRIPEGQTLEKLQEPKTSSVYKGDSVISKLPYKPEKSNGNWGFNKLPNFIREGSQIKGNVQSILNNKPGELDARHVFDGIDDDTIERNKPVAQATIENNISNGRLTHAQLEKYPHMLDGLTMYYASVDSGNSKAARFSRDVAYSEGKYPDIIPTGINLMSNDVTASDIEALKTSNDVVVQNNNAGKRYVGADGVRIRNGYGLNSTAMGLLNEGDEVEYTGRKTSEEIDGYYWAEIVHDGKPIGLRRII